MKVYIDTNVYISLLKPGSDLKPLKKLKRLIREQKISLVLPSQTKEEYARHSGKKIALYKVGISKNGLLNYPLNLLITINKQPLFLQKKVYPM